MAILYAPNLFHHLHVGDWLSSFPAARIHAPDGLSAKRPDLRIDRLHGADVEGSAFASLLTEIPIEGFRLRESVLLHRPSGTLLVADLVHNIGTPEHLWTRIYTTAMGFYGRVAMSRMIRWLGFSDRAAARRSLDRVLALDFESLVVGHGEPIRADAKELLTAAFSWL